jgi:hypothetical protein
MKVHEFIRTVCSVLTVLLNTAVLLLIHFRR